MYTAQSAQTRWRTSLGALLTLTFILASTGCSVIPRVPPQLVDADRYDPVVGILYYPFVPPAPKRAPVASPVPNREAWTEGRMELDLHRLTQGNPDVVFVVLPLAGTDRFGWERFRHFVELASAMPDIVRVAPWVHAPSGGKAYARRMLRNLLRPDTLNAPAWFRLDGRPLLVLDGPGRRDLERHPALTFRYAGKGPNEWPPPRGALKAPKFSDDGTYDLVSGGCRDHAANTWAVERQGGIAFREQFWTAVAKRPRFVVISSWNNFVRGDFLAPNSLDGKSAFDHWVREMRWLKNETDH